MTHDTRVPVVERPPIVDGLGADAAAGTELRDRLANLGLLVAGVAHEIRNPIAFVHSNLEVLERYTSRLAEVLQAYRELEQQPGSSEELADALRRVAELRREHRLDHVLDDLPKLISQSIDGSALARDIAASLKALSSARDDTRASADVAECCGRALLVSRNELKRKVDVVTEIDELPPVACGAAELTQILINLSINAAQAIETRGTLTLRVRRDGDEALIEVEDTGCGIAPENLERVFEPFFTTKVEGGGLGLALVSNMVRKWNGRIDVRSAPGQGTCFVVRFPLADPGGAG